MGDFFCHSWFEITHLYFFSFIFLLNNMVLPRKFRFYLVFVLSSFYQHLVYRQLVMM